MTEIVQDLCVKGGPASGKELPRYFASRSGQPHRERTRAILSAHPEIRKFTGRNVWTAVILLTLVALQFALAAGAGHAGTDSVIVAIVAAYLVGAFANHALYVIIHEATHDLIFRGRTLNRIAGMVADLPNLFPSASVFRTYHLIHHAHQGNLARDADLPSEWEARMVGSVWWRKALWLVCFPMFQALRPIRLIDKRCFDGWSVANTISCGAGALVVGSQFGWIAVLYLGLSTLFAIGLHPLGARWIQEHYTLDPAQETFSYYGPLNKLALNVGYHVEHHDFPSVPWHRLPRVRATADDFYASLHAHSSWTGLLIRFIFDRRFTLFSRVVRPS